MSDVLTRVEGSIGRITLNRPKALNALSQAMIDDIDDALVRWSADPQVGCILIEGAGDRGFCAGGDMRALYHLVKAGDFESFTRFFNTEYRMNARIARYPKPFISLMDGIVMGGGIGLTAHSNTRIVTERSTLAMPEVGIGFLPDVGSTYLLARAPGQLGVHLALTGGLFDAADSIYCGFADHLVPSAQLPDLIAALQRGGSDPTDVLAAFAAPVPAAKLEDARAWIDPSMDPNISQDSAAAIVERLEARSEPEAKAAAAEIRHRSPLALEVTLRSLREARRLDSLEACLRLEYRVATRFYGAHDFLEGIRAALVDKDRHPRWSPARLDGVPDSMVAPFFAELGAGELRFE